MIIVLTGVSGAGKTTVGLRLAEELDWLFIEGDDFHSQANVEKMQRGIPLNDLDRQPWLKSLRKKIDKLLQNNVNAIVSCSALKYKYRKVLCQKNATIKQVYLKGDIDTIKKRIEKRKGHFMPQSLLESQFELLEEPKNVLTISINNTVCDSVRKIKECLMLE